MRLSSGMQYFYGSDSSGPGLVISGDASARTVAPGKQWTLEDEKKDGKRTWRPPKGVALHGTKRPADNALREVLGKHLATLKPIGKHPALKDGLEKEAKRLHPKLSAAAQADFKRLVGYLRDNFGIDAHTWDGEPEKPFVDDFGPSLLAYFDRTPVPLPEMPPVYSAPAIWQQTMWVVNNSQMGPYTDPDYKPPKLISYSDPVHVPHANSPAVEGLIYFQGARFVVIHEAWLDNPDAPLLRKFVELITGGLRPWQD